MDGLLASMLVATLYHDTSHLPLDIPLDLNVTNNHSYMPNANFKWIFSQIKLWPSSVAPLTSPIYHCSCYNYKALPLRVL